MVFLSDLLLFVGNNAGNEEAGSCRTKTSVITRSEWIIQARNTHCFSS